MVSALTQTSFVEHPECQFQQFKYSLIVLLVSINSCDIIFQVPALLASEPCPQHISHIAELRAEEEQRQNNLVQDSNTDSEPSVDMLSLESKALKYDQMIERLTERRLRYEKQLERKRKATDTVERMQKKQRSIFQPFIKSSFANM